MTGPARRLRYLAAAFVTVWAAACGSMQPGLLPPERRFEYRLPGEEEIEEPVLTLRARADYLEMAAFLRDATVRIEPWPEGATDGVLSRRVEVFLEGAFPDACTELDRVEQERHSHLIHVHLIQRRARTPDCATIVRPFRFYVMLDGRFEVGAYMLKINDVERPFEVRAPVAR